MTPIPPIPEDLKRWSPAARLEGDKPHGYMVGDKEGLWYFASTVDERIAKLTAALQNIADGSAFQQDAEGNCISEAMSEAQAALKDSASRATRTPPQEGQ